MVLDFEYGINTGNRFLDLVDHDEDPEEFIARQTQPEEKPKKSKETKPVASATTKKPTKTTTTTASASTTNVSNNTTKTNKENLSGKSTNTEQRRQQSNVLSDNNNQQTRNDSGRGGGNRGFSRRGGSAGHDRAPYEGGNRGGGQQRSQRFHKFEGQQTSNETSGFDQGSEAWGGETTNDNNQSFGGYRGRGRGGPRRGNFEGGRGNYEGGRGSGRGNYEESRGGGRGRGRGGRGNFNNRNFDENSQQQQPQTQESSYWQQNTESNFDNTRSQPARTGSGSASQEVDADASTQDRSFEPDNNRRGGRGQFRSRTFHNNRNYGGDRQSQYERGTGDVSQDEYRHNRRQHDRQPRTNVSGVKPIEKKDGDGAHNWGHQTENPEEHPVADEGAETAGQAPTTSWAQQVDEAEKQMTLDEYKKQIEAKKQAQQEKVPQFNRRTAGEGEDPNNWQKFNHLYRKKNDDDSNEEELEEGSGGEEHEDEEEGEEEQISGKKKIISIPLRFKPIEMPRGPAGSRGGPRRGGSGGGRPFRDRPYRDDQTRSKSPSQQTPSTQQTGEYHNDEQQPRPYRGGGGGGGARQGSGRGEYRRPYGHSARGSRGGYNRSNIDPNTPDLDNKLDFPNLAKP